MGGCRICKSKLIKIIDLGKIALVGNFFKKVKNLKKFKISLNYCQNCKHIQISEILKPELLFQNYLWETGISKSNVSLINDINNKLNNFGISRKTKIFEIASNDGSFLKFIKKKHKCFVLGIDPAKNFKKVTKKNNINTITNYFSFKISKIIKKKYKFFDYIFARNVIAHTSDPNDIFKGVNNILSDNGIFILEVPHLLNIYNDNQYDNVFHEHQGFHTLKSIVDLSKKNNLQVFDVEKINSQGGSIRCYLKKSKSVREISKKIQKIILKERKIGLFSSNQLIKFRKKILIHKTKLSNLISGLKIKGKKISAYGASGKGQALLQYCKLDHNCIDNVFDKSKLKQGCYTPGTNIKIRNPKRISKLKIDFLLLLSWNLKNEILKQEKKFLKSGGKFIIPFPSPRILN